MPITREQFLERIKPGTRTVEIAGLGEVTIRGLSEKRRKECRAKALTGFDEKGNEQINRSLFQGLLVIDAVIEPKLSMEDLDALEEGKAGINDDLFMAVLDVSGISVKEIEAKKNESKTTPTTGPVS